MKVYIRSPGAATHYSLFDSSLAYGVFLRSLLSCSTLLIVHPKTEYNFLLQFLT